MTAFPFPTLVKGSEVKTSNKRRRKLNQRWSPPKANVTEKTDCLYRRLRKPGLQLSFLCQAVYLNIRGGVGTKSGRARQEL